LTAFFVGANDFADARPSEAFTRHHAFSFPYRYKNRYIVRAAGPIHPAARNEMTGTGTVTRPGLPFFICRSISRTVTAEKYRSPQAEQTRAGTRSKMKCFPLAVAVNGNEPLAVVDQRFRQDRHSQTGRYPIADLFADEQPGALRNNRGVTIE